MKAGVPRLLAAVSFVACSPEAPPTTAAATELPVVWTLDTVPLVSIGQADDADPVYALHQVGDVLLLPDFRIAVASQRSVVQIFDTSGTFQHGFGGDGGGPTEFRWLSRLLNEGDSILLVLEAGRPRVSRWRLTGELVSEYRYDAALRSELSDRSGFAVPSRARVMAIQSPSWAGLAEIVEARRGTGAASGSHIVEVSSAVVVFGENGVDTLTVARGPTWFYRADTGGFDGSVLYPRPVVGPWGRGGSFTNGARGTVEFYDAGGRLAAKVETGRTGVPATQAILDALQEERAASLRAIGATRPPNPVVLPAPERLKVYDRILQDGAECVWLERFRVPGTQTKDIDVVHPRRGLVAVLTIPANVRLRAIREDRVAAVTADSLGVQRVEVRHLRRTAGSVCPPTS
jgi:hypothetical protein